MREQPCSVRIRGRSVQSPTLTEEGAHGELLALAGFGFVLGMRHATDADHVIAVTTILSRTRRFAHSTLIGALWGLGHSITVLVVGMAIIVFGS